MEKWLNEMLTNSTIPFEKLQGYKSVYLDYLSQQDNVKPFQKYSPDLEGIKTSHQAIGDSTFNRDLLVEIITDQYKKCGLSTESLGIDRLKNSSSSTITTGHQLNIFTGPLYSIYKIATVIKLAKQAGEEFVPVFWMASEDHDYEEISTSFVFNKNLKWETSQEGAVGRFDPEGISELLGSFEGIPESFIKSYSESKTLSEATRKLVHSLFADYRLIVIDADDPELKKLAVPVFLKELKEGLCFEKVNSTGQALKSEGYHVQVNPREINLFYLLESSRERIVKENGKYAVKNSDITFDAKSIETELNNHPERFSPNALMRPVYQQIILPNSVYIGGPAEVAYWLQLKEAFDVLGVHFPVILPRFSGILLEDKAIKKMERLGLGVAELFLDEEKMIKSMVRNSNEELVDLKKDKEDLKKLFDHLEEKADKVDHSLQGYIKGELAQAMKQMDRIEKKLEKAAKSSGQDNVEQAINLKHKLFPDGVPQERKVNVLNVITKHPEFIDDVIQLIAPLSFQYSIMHYEKG